MPPELSEPQAVEVPLTPGPRQRPLPKRLVTFAFSSGHGSDRRFVAGPHGPHRRASVRWRPGASSEPRLKSFAFDGGIEPCVIPINCVRPERPVHRNRTYSWPARNTGAPATTCRNPPATPPGTANSVGACVAILGFRVCRVSNRYTVNTSVANAVPRSKRSLWRRGRWRVDRLGHLPPKS